MAEVFDSRDTLWNLVKKILQNLSGLLDGTYTINFSPSGGSAPSGTSTVTMTGTAIEAIPAGSKGYVSAASDNNAGPSVFVGGADVTIAGVKRGIELTPAGISPLLTGPVYVIGTASDVVGVVLV